MKYEYTLSEKDIYDCYKAFFGAKNTKFNNIMKWCMVGVVGALIVVFFTLVGLHEYHMLVEMGIIILCLALLTFVGYFNQPILKLMARNNYRKTKLALSDKVIINIEDGEYREYIYAGDNVLMLSKYQINDITRLEEDDDNFYVMFGPGSASVIKKQGASESILIKTGELLAKGRDHKALLKASLKATKAARKLDSKDKSKLDEQEVNKSETVTKTTIVNNTAIKKAKTTKKK